MASDASNLTQSNVGAVTAKRDQNNGDSNRIVEEDNRIMNAMKLDNARPALSETTEDTVDTADDLFVDIDPVQKCENWLDHRKDYWDNDSETVSTCDSSSIISTDLTTQLVLQNSPVMSGNASFGQVSVSNSEKVYIGNITNINVYKTKTEKKISESNRPSIIMEECVPDNIFLGNNNVKITPPAVLSMISRRRWLAQEAIQFEEFASKPDLVVILHTATESPSTIAENVALVRDIQMLHVEARKWKDIGYNFLIGEDGQVYEGRGWTRIGAHTIGYNVRSIGVAFIGCYMTRLPPERSMNAFHALMAKGIADGHLDANYSLLAHCQCSSVESPGKALYAVIKNWPHWVEEPPPR